MKKHMMRKRYSTHAETGPDIAGLINKMQEQMVSLERKIDTLIGRPSQKPAEVKPFPGHFQQSRHARGRGVGSPEGRSPASYRGGSRQDNSYRERTLHKAICADCNKECEVPFAPSGGRPVYCKECFSKRKAGSPEGRPAASYRGESNPHRERYVNGHGEAPRLRSGQVSLPQMSRIDKPQGGDSPEGHPAASYRGGGRKNYAEKKKPATKRRKARA